MEEVDGWWLVEELTLNVECELFHVIWGTIEEWYELRRGNETRNGRINTRRNTFMGRMHQVAKLNSWMSLWHRKPSRNKREASYDLNCPRLPVAAPKAIGPLFQYGSWRGSVSKGVWEPDQNLARKKRVLECSDKYRLIFIAEHWDPACSDKYRLVFIAEYGTQSAAINIAWYLSLNIGTRHAVINIAWYLSLNIGTRCAAINIAWYLSLNIGTRHAAINIAWYLPLNIGTQSAAINIAWYLSLHSGSQCSAININQYLSLHAGSQCSAININRYLSLEFGFVFSTHGYYKGNTHIA